MTQRVAITQPYIPTYRVPLWEAVIADLAQDQIEVRVFYGGDAEQTRARARRGDAATVPWAQSVKTRTWTVPFLNRKIVHRSLPRDWSRSLLVTEMQAGNGNAWLSLMARRPYITFGHGRTYTAREIGPAERLESVLNSRATHVLTYTEGGRSSVLNRTALSQNRVTAFNNATDTTRLRNAIAAVTPADIAELREQKGIPDEARLALFIGTIDKHKRIDILIDAARQLLAEDDTHWLVVAGDGPESPLIDALARESNRVVQLGQATPEEIAPFVPLASTILNPGRVGLIAVDALVMGLPVLTTDSGDHAPEAEYLELGRTLFSSAANGASFASLWRSHRPDDLSSMTPDPPSIEEAAKAIARVVRSAVRQADQGSRS